MCRRLAVHRPHLIGYGQSGKPDIGYRFFDQVRYLDAFVERMNLDDIVLVAQDWGTALAFHFAARRPQRVLGLAFMEFIQPFARWKTSTSGRRRATCSGRSVHQDRETSWCSTTISSSNACCRTPYCGR